MSTRPHRTIPTSASSSFSIRRIGGSPRASVGAAWQSSLLRRLSSSFSREPVPNKISGTRSSRPELSCLYEGSTPPEPGRSQVACQIFLRRIWELAATYIIPPHQIRHATSSHQKLRFVVLLYEGSAARIPTKPKPPRQTSRSLHGSGYASSSFSMKDTRFLLSRAKTSPLQR